MAALPHRTISAIAKRITASLEFRCGGARFISSTRRANGQVPRIIGFGPFLETKLSAIVWRSSADAITAAIENDPLKASQRGTLSARSSPPQQLFKARTLQRYSM
jgi:hypothetical protein